MLTQATPTTPTILPIPAMEGADNRAVISEAQFERAYRAEFSRTVRYLSSRGVAADVAEELAQAAWARGWECRAQLRDAGAVGRWVISIAKNLLRVSFRGRRETEDLNEDSASFTPDTDSLLVSQVLRDLPNVDRQLLFDVYAEGCSSTELGPRLGISPVAVRVRVTRLKNKLRESLAMPAQREALAC